MIRFSKVDDAVLQVADQAAARRETKARQHLEALCGAMHRRVRNAPKSDLVESLAVLALVARTLFPGSVTSGDDDFHATEARYSDLFKSRLAHDYVEMDTWLRTKAEAALARLEVQAALSARDGVGAPLFDTDRPVTWYRVPEPIKLALLVHFLLSLDDPREVRWLR